MSQIISTAPPSGPKAQENPFLYGWRFLRHVQPDGTIELEQVPLTLEDVLHPQEGDETLETPRHEMECSYLAWALRAYHAGNSTLCIFNDCLIDWGVEGVRNHSPDVSVFRDVRNPPDLTRGTFVVAASGGQPVLAIEVVSQETRVNDVTHKFAEYWQVGLPLYVIIDQEREGGPRRVLGYRWGPQRFEPLQLDAEGRLLIEPLNVRIGLKDGGVVLYDAAKGQQLADPVAAIQQLKAAEERERQQSQARQKAEERIIQMEDELRRLRGQG